MGQALPYASAPPSQRTYALWSTCFLWLKLITGGPQSTHCGGIVGICLITWEIGPVLEIAELAIAISFTLQSGSAARGLCLCVYCVSPESQTSKGIS